ncbi:rRNA maturation RNase YbeY [soil metagenome]
MDEDPAARDPLESAPEVFLADEQDLPVDDSRLVSLARHALLSQNVPASAELSVLLIGEEHMRRLNARFAGNDYATDVLSFPLMEGEEEGPLVLGDIVVCPAVAAKNAERLGHSQTEEMDTLLVHGLLHILGHDHQGAEDKAAMEERLALILRSFDPARA